MLVIVNLIVKFVKTLTIVKSAKLDIIYIKVNVLLFAQFTQQIVSIMKIWYHVFFLYYLDSRYLAKGFYDLNMTIEDIDSFYDSVSDPGNNFQTGQKFSFLNEKIVLGGMLVWTNSIYKKNWAIS